MNNNPNGKKNNNNSLKKANASAKNNTVKSKPKRSEAALARRAAKWATQKAEKKAESIAKQKEKQEAKKVEEERKAKTVLELFPNVMGIVGAQGYMPNIKRSTLLSKNLSQKLKNTPLFQNADRSTIYPNGLTILHKYLEEGNWEEAMKVLDLGVSKKVLEHPMRFGMGTPLVYAYTQNQFPLFKKLLEKGANPNVMVQQNRYETPLIHSICHDRGYAEKRLEYIKALIKYNAKYDEVDRYGYTPLDTALINHNDDIAKFFIDIGVDIQKPNAKGFTPLLTAIGSSRLDVLEYMIQKCKPNLNKQTGPNKLSPLKMATLNGKKEILEELLKHNVDLDQQDNEGNSALHYAILTRNYEKIRLLKEKGASSFLKNKEGVTPLDLAKRLLRPANPKTAPTMNLLEQ